MPNLQPSALPFCAGCAKQTDANLSCARCRVDYCSRKCPKVHWTSGGHKHACAGLARARRDTDLDVQSRALARVSYMGGCAPDLCIYRQSVRQTTCKFSTESQG